MKWKMVFDDFLFQKLVTLFISKENGIVLQDTKTTSAEYIKLLGVDIPHFVTLKKSSNDAVIKN